MALQIFLGQGSRARARRIDWTLKRARALVSLEFGQRGHQMYCECAPTSVVFEFLVER